MRASFLAAPGAFLVTLAACINIEVSEADYQSLRNDIVAAVSEAGVPVLVWSITWDQLPANTTGDLGFSATYTNTDRERVLANVTLVVAAFDRSGDPVLGEMSRHAEVRLVHHAVVAPNETVHADWQRTWRKSAPFWYSDIGRVDLRRVELEFENGDRAIVEYP